MNKKEMMLKAPMHKVVISLALPVMLSNLMQTFYNLADTYWVGQYEMVKGLSGELLSSILIIWPAINIIFGLGTGIAMASVSLISQFIGSGKEEKARRVAGQALLFAFLLSIVLGLLGSLFTPWIVKALGAPNEIFDNAVIYLRIMMWGLPTIFLFFTYNSIKQAQGDMFTPMLFSILSVGANIILDPIFMIVFDWGIAGAAIATVLSRGVFIIFAIAGLFKENKRHIKLHLRDLKYDQEIIQYILKIGVPSTVSNVMTSIGFAVLNWFVVSFGLSTLTAFGIGNRITGIILMPAMGIGSALSAIVGTNLGADDVKRARKAVRTSFLLSSSILVAGGLIIFLNARNIILLFNNDPETVRQSTTYLKLIIAAIPLMAGFSVLRGTFNGSGHTKFSLLISAGRLWGLRIPLIVLFKTFTNLGTNSVWYAMILSNLIICLIGLAIYKTGVWESKVTKEAKVQVA